METKTTKKAATKKVEGVPSQLGELSGKLFYSLTEERWFLEIASYMGQRNFCAISKTGSIRVLNNGSMLLDAKTVELMNFVAEAPAKEKVTKAKAEKAVEAVTEKNSSEL